MTTISPEIPPPPAAPCPVAWCENRGQHDWTRDDPNQQYRTHVRHTHGEGSEHEIGAELAEWSDQTQSTYVILFDLSRGGSATQELHTPGAVDAVIHALADASSLAFSPAEVPDGSCPRGTAWCRSHNERGNAGCLGGRVMVEANVEYDTTVALRPWRSADEDDPGMVSARLFNGLEGERDDGFEFNMSSDEARTLAGQLLRIAAQLDRQVGRR